ncbi:hypothetical protein H4R35_006729 [Dimargaris xerosporica]|nr:hypothetical protein H4R35_006729 [Dimargaris xerosporica]
MADTASTTASSYYSEDVLDYEQVPQQDKLRLSSMRRSASIGQRGLEWYQLSYKVATERQGWRRRVVKTKTLLEGVSGKVKPGEMVAIMGSSGAGKSTLLNALSGRLTTGKLRGQVLFNGLKRIPGRFRRQVAYVEQDDLLYSQLTVKETISYAATLRLPDQDYTDEQKGHRVRQVLELLRLEGVANTRIGNFTARGVSGGERKRTSIGIELVTDPEFMFLDEATTGLDSNSAYHVCEVIKDVARQCNMGVLMTIHQPSAKVLSLFDKAILLSKGQLVYYGPVPHALHYFAGLGYECQKYENPANFYLDLMTVDFSSPELKESTNARVDHLIAQFRQHMAENADFYDLSKNPVAATNRHSTCTVGTIDALSRRSHPLAFLLPSKRQSMPAHLAYLDELDSFGTWALPWAKEFGLLVGRCWKTQMRNKLVVVSVILKWLLLTLLMGFSFFQLDRNQTDIQNRLGLLFYLPIDQAFGIVMPLLGVFSMDRDVMLRERNAHSYRVSSFYLAKNLTEIPLTLAVSVVYLVGVYFLANFQYEVGKFFIFFGVNILMSLTTIAMGMAIGASCRTLKMAELVYPTFIIIMLMYAGNLVITDDITPVLSWIRFLSPIKYCYQALAINEFTGLTFSCSGISADAACVTTGEEVLRNNALDTLAIKTCVALLVAVGAVFHAWAYINLRWRNKPRYIWI